MARNKDYWARRAKRTQDAILDRVFEEYVARVQEAYTDAIHAMDAKMRTWIQRLADNNEISYADAQKLLAKNELEEFHWSVEQYIKHGTDNLDGQWSKQLENASARVHISRYDAMKFELQALAKEATGKTIETIKDAAALAYTESYNHTAFDLQQQVGVGVSMQGVDSRKLEHVLNRPWSDDGKTFSARCWEGCDNLVSKVNRELFRMVATGEKPDRAIAAIADEFGKTKRTAGRLVMTESAAIASQAQHNCYTELGVEEFEVIGTFDAHMCDFCGEMDGKHFPESKRKIGENAPPFHPWCRCTTAPYDEDLKGVGTRWMRDPETGKGGYVPADMTYQEWKDQFMNNGIEHEGSKRKYTYAETIVDKSTMDISYRKKFSVMGESENTTRSMWNAAKEMLDHRSGTKFEDLAFIDSKTGKTLIRKDYNVERKVLPTKAMKKYVTEHEPYTIIAIHNHPGSSVPSVQDLDTAFKKKYKFGVACGHNGTVFKYSVAKQFNYQEIDYLLDILQKSVYNEDARRTASILDRLSELGIRLEVL